MLLTHRPAQPLAAFVDGLWYYDGRDTSQHTDHVLPNGKFQMVIGLAANVGAVSGMRSQHVVVTSGAMAAAMGVVFRPGGARGFFAFPASDFFNRAVALDAVWDSELPNLRDRLLEAATPRAKFRRLESVLLELLHRRGEKRIGLHPAVQHGLQDFRRTPHVATVMDVAKQTGLSRRRFSQLFDEQVGMTPKLYCRVMRFRAVGRQVASGGPVDWADVALAGGYYDQAHLSHEFRQFSGMSPTSFVAAHHPYVNHVRIEILSSV
jgi:AraC-like DNA-binding protein